MFEYGDKVKDIVTKVEGVITGHSDYVTGCDQYLVQPINKKKDLKPVSMWFDENRLIKIGEDKDTKTIFRKKEGADMQAHTK